MLAATLAGVLGAGLLAVPPAGARPGEAQRLKGQVEKIDKDGREVRGVGQPSTPKPAAKLAAPVWPPPSAARVTVPPGRSSGAGSLPVSLRRPAGVTGSHLTEASVQVLDRTTLPERWRDGLVARIAAPTESAAGAVAVTVDYQGFRHAYGAGWSSRLRLWELPECALSTPDKAGCAARALPSRNDPAAAAVTGDASIRAAGRSGTLLALAAGPSGPAGDYAATSLSPSSTWSAGGSTGGFTWAYPMRVPEAMGGPQPKVELSYSSSSVDGRSSATNNQPSWIGEGFEFWPGYIERRYIPCSEDKEGSANNPDQTGDLCWRSDNATMSLNGAGNELIFQTGKGWHGRAEDGSKIEKVTGTSNGDDNNEAWKVTTTDGTQYFFGLNAVPGRTGATDSVWTVPVYGNHPDEPCKAATFSASDCRQAWRWNLDYVVDVHGNTLSYWYEKETNRYAAEVKAEHPVTYDRGGHLRFADYGTWDRGATDRSVTPTAQVEFTPGDRCETGCTAHDATRWPDVPWDQECRSDAATCNDYSPTFWSTKRLAKVTTRVWDTTKTTPAWQTVDSWTFDHSFPSPGDGSEGGLWLQSIVHTGHVGGTEAMPPVTLDPVAMTNRVLTRSNTTNNWQRLAAITTETGATVKVSYSLPDCTDADKPSNPAANTRLCYPVIGPDPYSTSGGEITEWWHKYVVTQVTETDVQLAGGHQSPTKNTRYRYIGAPAWHYADDDGFTKPRRKTWNQFRGFATVETRVGDSAQTLTRTSYLRGMHGDRAAKTGGTRTVTVPASVGTETVYDEDQFAGMIREQVIYNGTDDKPVSKKVNVPWRSPPTASRTINGDTVTASYVNTQTTYAATALGVNGARGWRVTSSKSKFDDAYGTVDWSQDNGDTGKTGDEKCTTYTYNRNPGRNLTTLPRRILTTTLTCGNAPTSAEHIVSDAVTFYDNATDPATVPQRGLPTRADGLKDWTAAGGTVYQNVGSSTFDPFGRPLASTDIKGNTTKTTYSPATGPVASVTSSNHLNWNTVTQKNPYWSLPTTVTDPNKRVTDITYDPLGRVRDVWEAGWPKAANPTRPSSRYTYVYDQQRATYPFVKTETLNAVGRYRAVYEIYDGFLRPRQTQTTVLGNGERVVTDTLYDAHGRPELTYGAHAEPGDAGGDLWWEPEWSVPTQTVTTYDRANRPTRSTFRSGLGENNMVDRWHTTTTYEGDSTTVVPPKGGVASTTVTDAQARTVELRQYTTASGPAGDADTTRYTYNAKDQLTKVTDPAGNEWTHRYDVRGRRIESRDPDRGTTTTTYNDYDEITETLDAAGNRLLFTYDTLGRKTSVSEPATTPGGAPVKRAEWKYDRLYTMAATVRGQMTEAIRYVGGEAYKWQVRGFTTRDQPSAAHYVIPAREKELAGTYVYGYTYSPFNGAPESVVYPAAGNLPDEGVTTRYNDTTGLATSLTSAWASVGTYVEGQTYSSYGEPTVTTMKIDAGVFAEQSVSYDVATRRVDTVTVKPETAGGPISKRKYSYTDAGTIIGISDTPSVGTADHQCFRYDSLARLTSAWTPSTPVDCRTATPTVADLNGPASYWQDWTLDKAGNRLKGTSHSPAGNTVRDYAVPASGPQAVRPHAVTALTTTTPGQTAGTTAAFAHDAIGNMTTRPTTSGDQTLSWDPEGRLATVTQGGKTVEENLYDAEGTRLIRRDPAGATLFLPGMEVRLNGTGAGYTMSATRYYSFNGQIVASRTPTNQSLSWLFGDHQGTQQIAVNAYSQQVQTRRQTPYGETRGTPPTWPNGKGFVGGDNDPTGLVNIGARQYDPTLGRFISVDPLQDLSDPAQWNPYAYANNSPVSNSDPTGLKPMVTDTAAGDSAWMLDNGSNLTIGDDGMWGVVDDTPARGPRGPGSATNGGSNQTAGNGLSQAEIERARKIREKNAVQVIIEAGGKVLMEFFGINDILDCARKRDVKACAMTLVDLFPFGKMIRALKTLPVIARAGKAVLKWMDDVKWADDVLARAQKSCHSFRPTTRVLMANGSTKPIKDVKVGDKVKATDPETGRVEVRAVTATHSNTDTYLTKLTVRTTKGGRTETAVLSTTENHPFWDETTDSWVDAGRLVPGTSVLRSADGRRQDVATVVNYFGRQNMRDLTVADIHTYYVLAGNTPVLVHNCNVPAGFAGKADYNAFVGTLDDGLAATGHGGTRAAFQGSSVTGVSFRSGRSFGSHSDYDVALGGDAVFARAKELGIPLRGGGTRTGPLKGAHLDALGLTGLRNQLTGMAGREVNFMIYGNIDNAMARSPSLPAVGCGC
jgi:RHS repeat-associated protein